MRGEQALLVNGMSGRFLGGEKASAKYGAVSAEGENRGKPAAIDDTARGKHRQVADRIANFGNQRERRDGSAHVSSRLESLRDNRVGAGALRRQRLFSRAALPDDAPHALRFR